MMPEIDFKITQKGWRGINKIDELIITETG